jgi:hypothetical protein
MVKRCINPQEQRFASIVATEFLFFNVPPKGFSMTRRAKLRLGTILVEMSLTKFYLSDPESGTFCAVTELFPALFSFRRSCLDFSLFLSRQGRQSRFSLF